MTTTSNQNKICKGICKNGNPCKCKASDWTTGFTGYCGKHNWDEDGNPHPPINEEKPPTTYEKVMTYLKYDKDMKTFKYEQDFVVDAKATITGFEKMALMYDKAPEKPTDDEIAEVLNKTKAEKKALYSKKYREENKEKLALKKKEYKLGKKAEISEYNKTHYLKIKDEVKVKNDEKKEDKATKVKCECGAVVRKDGLTNHKKTAKHAKGLEQK